MTDLPRAADMAKATSLAPPMAKADVMMVPTLHRSGSLALLLLASACGARSELSTTPPRTAMMAATRCLLFGGFPSVGGGTDDDTWIWDGATWSAVSTTPPDAVTGTMVTFAGSPVLFPSPDTSLTSLLSVWAYQNGTWSEANSAQAPVGRTGAAVAVGAGGVVLFGGLANDGTDSALGDTWVWDGSTWTEKTPATSPPARWFSAAAGLDGHVVLFGGTGSMGALGDTWIWDGSTWTEATSASAPSPRVGARATTIGDRVLLFGGCAEGGVTGCEFTGTELGAAISSPPLGR
jgi:hypothetical protein